ncbi:hypothetical protein [Pseudonocardia sp. TMWB2A]|uniref:hypothetical protein n=1 Tax=Pseudonocardia sp. TMWB2A TaxID=687430 RepID=UPI00307F21B4
MLIPIKAAAVLDRISGLDLVWVELEDNPAPDALVARLQLMTARGEHPAGVGRAWRGA